MKIFLTVATLLGATVALGATEASAAVCARGVHRVGCAGPRGAVVARRPVVAPRAVAPRVICARGVYRAGCITRR